MCNTSFLFSSFKMKKILRKLRTSIFFNGPLQKIGPFKKDKKAKRHYREWSVSKDMTGRSFPGMAFEKAECCFTWRREG